MAHGAIPVARTALENGANWLAVATAEEAEELRDAGFVCPVLVLGALDEEDCALCVARGISVSVSMQSSCVGCIRRRKGKNTAAKAHLKIDTGFHRLGAVPEQLPSLLEAFPLPKCEDGGYVYALRRQMQQTTRLWIRRCSAFSRQSEWFSRQAFTPIVHISNSAATLRRPELRRDMVRAGIILYGYAQRRDAGKSGSMACHELEKHGAGYPYHRAGETVGYGRTYTAHEQKKGCYLAGGICRRIPSGAFNKGQVLVCGQRAPVLGRICMDHFMVDITEIPRQRSAQRWCY